MILSFDPAYFMPSVVGMIRSGLFMVILPIAETQKKKKGQILRLVLFSSGGRTYLFSRQLQAWLKINYILFQRNIKIILNCLEYDSPQC